MTTCSSLTDFSPSHNSDTSPRCHSTRSKPWVSYSSRRRSKSEIEMAVRTRRFYGQFPRTQQGAPVLPGLQDEVFRRWVILPSPHPPVQLTTPAPLAILKRWEH